MLKIPWNILFEIYSYVRKSTKFVKWNLFYRDYGVLGFLKQIMGISYANDVFNSKAIEMQTTASCRIYNHKHVYFRPSLASRTHCWRTLTGAMRPSLDLLKRALN